MLVLSTTPCFWNFTEERRMQDCYCLDPYHILFVVVVVIVVLSLIPNLLFATPWIVACQASLSFTISWSLLKFMSIESVMLSNHLIPCRPLLLSPSIFPSIRVFLMSRLFTSSGQSIGASALASVLPMNVQA